MSDPKYPMGSEAIKATGEKPSAAGPSNQFRGESDPGISAFSDLDFNKPKGTPKPEDTVTSGMSKWPVAGEVPPPAPGPNRPIDVGTDLKL